MVFVGTMECKAISDEVEEHSHSVWHSSVATEQRRNFCENTFVLLWVGVSFWNLAWLCVCVSVHEGMVQMVTWRTQPCNYTQCCAYYLLRAPDDLKYSFCRFGEIKPTRPAVADSYLCIEKNIFFTLTSLVVISM